MTHISREWQQYNFYAEEVKLIGCFGVWYSLLVGVPIQYLKNRVDELYANRIMITTTHGSFFFFSSLIVLSTKVNFQTIIKGFLN